MSSHTSHKLPSSEWFYLDMFQSKQQTIYPKMIPKIRRHFSKVYLSAGPKYASDQDRFQSTLKESQVDFLRGVEPFEVVIIDSLNPFFQSIQDLFPATIYLIGQERDDITTNVSKTWTPGHVLPFSTDNPYFQELVKAPTGTYEDCQVYTANLWKKMMGQDLLPMPEEVREMERERHIQESPHGDIIWILQQYSSQKWTAISHSPLEEISTDRFLIQFQPRCQEYIYKIDLTREYLGKTYTGGQIVRPVQPRHRFEFEQFFGLGMKCRGYYPKLTRYFYPVTLNSEYAEENSVFQLLDGLPKHPRDREFYRFVMWIAVHQMGVLVSNAEGDLNLDLSEIMEMDPLTEEEMLEIIYPKID